MRPDKFFFPDMFNFNGNDFYGQRHSAKSQLLIPVVENDSPFDIGDVVVQKVGTKERPFEVLDYEIHPSLDAAGGNYSFIVTLKVKALDVKEKPNNVTTQLTFNGAITAGGDFQAGNTNNITKHITIEQLQEAIENSGDQEVKGIWQKLLENPTFASIAAALAKGAMGQ